MAEGPQFPRQWLPGDEITPLPRRVAPEHGTVEAFWDYQDLAILLGAGFVSLAASFVALAVFSRFLPFGKPFQALVAQLLFYALFLASMYALLKVRYGQPFWISLGWKVPFRGTLIALIGGPFLAITMGYIGHLIRTPDIQLPFHEMLADLPTTILFGVLVVGLGPLFEELTFRGFLMPLLVRSLGPAGGILLTALLFGALHAPEYRWSWQHILLVSLAGAVFGLVRQTTGSTAAATFMHCTYNLTQFAAFLIQNKPQW
jgi:membrane protease YdiL (CAAX protease family)